MTELPHLQELFQRLRSGYHLSPEDEPIFSAVASNYEAYKAYFAPLGLNLVRHERDFFYFEPEDNESSGETLPRIALFSFILIDYIANTGKAIEESLFGEHFLISRLPHFSLERYSALLQQVDVEDSPDLRQILRNMERLGWVKFVGEEEFRFLRPFYRVLDKCLDLSRAGATAALDTSII